MRNIRMVEAIFVLLGLLGLTGVAHGRLETSELDNIVANNERVATRGQGTSAIKSLEIKLRMHDRGTLDADYKVTRDGRMRIDILKDGKRVYTEAYDGRGGWDWVADGSAPTQDPHGAALWHGTQFPGGIFTLRDMAGLGHKLEYAGRERLDGIEYYVLKLTLSDGFVTYRYVNPTTWLIDRGRDYRAFHPALDRRETWVETRWSEYRPVHGVLFSFASTNRDLRSGKILATQEVTSIKVNPPIDPSVFVAPDR